MNTAKIYFKDNHWCVDYIDNNQELSPSVGIFSTLEQARQSALVWVEGVTNHVAIVGQSTW